MNSLGHPVSGKVLLNNQYDYLTGTSISLGCGHDICGVDEGLGKILLDASFFDNSPFKWVSGSIIFQLRNLDCFGTITIDRISKKYECAGNHIYPDYRIFHAADALSREALLNFYKIMSLHQIIVIGKKYNLPTSVFEEMLAKMGSIPRWTEEMGEPILDPEKEGGTWNDKWMQNPQLVIDRYNESIGVDTSNDNRYLKFSVQTGRKQKEVI
jgi:hypothetical protein